MTLSFARNCGSSSGDHVLRCVHDVAVREWVGVLPVGYDRHLEFAHLIAVPAGVLLPATRRVGISPAARLRRSGKNRADNSRSDK